MLNKEMKKENSVAMQKGRCYLLTFYKYLKTKRKLSADYTEWPS